MHEKQPTFTLAAYADTKFASADFAEEYEASQGENERDDRPGDEFDGEGSAPAEAAGKAEPKFGIPVASGSGYL